MKHRDNIYLVVRVSEKDGSSSVCGAYSSLEDADNKADAYNQNFKDKGLDMLFKFEVQLTTYYDE